MTHYTTLEFRPRIVVSRNTEAVVDDNHTFVQYVADNVDHNIRSLDGYGTFHGMCMIAASTPDTKTKRVVSRLNPTIGEINSLAKINIRFYKEQSMPLGHLGSKY